MVRVFLEVNNFKNSCTESAGEEEPAEVDAFGGMAYDDLGEAITDGERLCGRKEQL